MRLSLPVIVVATTVLGGISACNGDLTEFSSKWEEPASDPAPVDHGSWLSFDVAPDNERIVMSYYDRERGGLGFGIGTIADDGTLSWFHERVDGYPGSDGLDRGDRGKYSSMKVAEDGTVWIAYQDVGKGTLWAAHRQGGGGSLSFDAENPQWVLTLVDAGTGTTPSAGHWVSLDLDADDNPVIASYDALSHSLKVSRLDADASTPSFTTTEAWTGAPWSGVDAEGVGISRVADVGTFAELMIDGTNEYIAFYDAAQQRLSLIEGTGGAWTQSFVTPEGTNAGQWPSMMIDAGTLFLAYHDVTNQNLMIATRTTGGYELELVDGGDFVGADTEIVKKAGAVGILYFDGQNNDQKFATRSGAVWVAETIAGDGEAVGFHNEVAQVGDRWIAGSYSFSTREVRTVELP